MRKILLFAGLLLILSSLTGEDQGIVAGSKKGASEASHGSPTIVTLRRSGIGVASSSQKARVHPAIDQPDIRPVHQRIATEILHLLPRYCGRALHNFYVRYDDAFKDRGLAGAHSIILTGNVQDSEYRALALHEFGHIADLGCIAGTPKSGFSGFRDGQTAMWENDVSVKFYRISWMDEKTRRPEAVPEEFVSGYAASLDAFEDFAETFAYYVLHRSAFQKRAETNLALAAKLKWMETYLPIPETVATGEEWKEEQEIPWDVTLLPHVWNGAISVASR